MAAFAETAYKQPAIIQGSLTDDGIVMENGVQVHVWTYRYYSGTTPEFLTVNNYFAGQRRGVLLCRPRSDRHQHQQCPLGALMEKAYAEIYGGNYAKLNGGYAQTVLPMETGGAAGGNVFASQSSFVTAVNSGSTLLTLACWSDLYGLIADHDYAVLSYNAANPNFSSSTIPGAIDQPGPLTWAQLKQCFTQDGDTVVNSASEMDLPFGQPTNEMAPNAVANSSSSRSSVRGISVENPTPITGINPILQASLPGEASLRRTSGHSHDDSLAIPDWFDDFDAFFAQWGKAQGPR